jgi:hypothetical protein
MGLSRLENFLRSIRGNIIYVDPNALDSTDSIENEGTSAARPFKTIQRALIEAARFSYLPGLDNDKFANTTVLVYPGEHLIDNRPGWIPDSYSGGNVIYKLRNGQTSTDFYPLDSKANFDLESDNNILYKFNSIHGGVMVPRGTSIVGMDLRKTKLRPKYVPNPENDNIERSALFRLTGGCYLWQLSIFDGNPNEQVFKDYTSNKFVPNFSHHKLTAFEYADGVNKITIDDFWISNYSLDKTDLDVYYEKIGLAYGPSARNIQPDFPSSEVDIQTKIDEYRIVGSRGAEVGITSIRAGDGVTSSKVITAMLESELDGLDVDTPIRINGLSASGYNGQYVVSKVLSSTEIQYAVSNAPTNPQGGSGGVLNIVVDTVTSASPYIFNCSLRSVYGMCGLYANGSVVDGFKSIVVAQFTGISLQKDNNAFVKYNAQSGIYQDKTNIENIYSDSLARYKSSYENYHIKCSDNAFIQCVSIFAIGYASHFLAESGGDISITNSNSNFGARSLVSKGYQDAAFLRDDIGYISHIIPPKEIESKSVTLEYDPIDIDVTKIASLSNCLYFYDKKDKFSPPKSSIDGYRIGAKKDDTINVLISSPGITTQYSANIVMPGGEELNYQKSYDVEKLGAYNNIVNNTITFTQNHGLLNGETVRIISDTGSLPDNINPEKVYYAITNASNVGLSAKQIKLATSLNDALNGNQVGSDLTIYSNELSNLKVVSRVSDKKCGDIGHPVQYDTVRNQWYINVKTSNDIYNSILSLSGSTSRTFITRLTNTRSLDDSIYKVRFVIPKESLVKARPPLDGYILQESSSTKSINDSASKQFGFSLEELDDSTEIRNLRLISNASIDGTTATITTELPHNLSVSSKVQVSQVLSTNNVTGLSTTGYNGTYTVTSIPNSRQFTYELSTSPGTFLDNTSTREDSLPYYVRKNLLGTYYVYRSEKIQEYSQGQQDGIYHLIIANSSNSPTVEPFRDLKFSQPIQNLYPQVDKDNPNSDPDKANSFALPNPIGQVIINDPEKSITKETIEKYFRDQRVGYGITNTVSDAISGIAHTFYTSIDHGLNPVTSLSIVSSGSNYGTTGAAEILYNARLVGFAGSTVGENGSAVISVNSSGQITNIKVMNGGSGYGIGNTMTVVGVATTTGWVPAVVQVASIYNHVNEVIQVTGITTNNYNQLYRITGVPSSKTIQVSASSSITYPGHNIFQLQDSNVYLVGKSLTASYVGTATSNTVTTATYHGLSLGDRIRIQNASNNENLGDYTIKSVLSSTTFELTAKTLIGTYGSIYVYPYRMATSADTISKESESLSSRLISNYGGITAYLSAAISNVNATTLSIANVTNLGLKIGDYIEIDNEIMRISDTIVSNPISVFRGLLGTKKDTHINGSIVRKINPIPIEFRRHSILRASGHTFEYLGFGPGNYSTAFPERQDRQLSGQEELLSQSFKSDGGINVYTGMNNDGDFYIGNKRITSATGQEEIFDAPIPTSRGDELDTFSESGINITNTLESNINRRIRVEGGKTGNIVSEFNGPVIFNNKVTINDDIETNSLYIQGSEIISRKYTIGISTPSNFGNSGDVVYNAVPDDGDSLGWVYTNQNAWRKFGPIKNSLGQYVGIWSGSFSGDGSGLNNLVTGWVETPVGLHTTKSVGIGTTASTEYKLTVKGNTYISGLLNVTEVIEKATISSNVLDGLADVNIDLGDNNVYYFTTNAGGNWTINFRGSSTTSLNTLLEVGDSLTVAILTSQGINAYYNSAVKIDGTSITPKYYSGYPFDSGNVGGIDVYTYVIIKTANNTFTVLASQSQYT